MQADRERPLERRPDLFRHVHRAGRVDESGKEDRELVAAEPRDEIAGRHDFAEASAGGDQHLVADDVTQAVVDHLEEIEIDEEHGGERPVPPPPFDFRGQPPQEQATVGKLGQGVVLRLVRELALGGGASQIHAVKEQRVPRHHRGEDRHDRDDQQPQSEGGVDDERLAPGQAHRAEDPRDDDHRRQQPPDHRPAAAVAGDHGHDAVGRPGAQHPDRHDHEHQRGRQRHRDLRADAVERAQAIGIAHQRQQGRHRRAERQQLRRPAEAAQRAVDDHQGGAEQQEVDRRIRRHLVRPAEVGRQELVVEEQPIDAGIVEPHDRQDPRRAEERRDGGKRNGQPARQRQVGLRGDQPERTAAADEPDGRCRVHRRQSRNEAQQRLGVEGPADQYENADEGCQEARRGSDRGKRVDEPRHQELVVQIRLEGKRNRVVSSSRAHQMAGYRSVSG